MPDKYLYLSVDLLCLLFPLLFSFHPRIRFYKQWRYFLLPCVATAAFFLVWDIIFVIMGVWWFNPRYITGIFLYNMPLEEVLFFICIPYACTFTYYCIDKFIKFVPTGKGITIFNYVLISALTVTAFLNSGRAYTSVTFILLSLFLLLLNRSKFDKWKPFYLSYLLILIPFLISNGILTGATTSEPVVIYNNDENLGIRIITIPFEDAFYAMLMMGMNVYGFERLRRKALVPARG